MPGPALHRREVLANVKKAMAPKFVIARSEATWQSRSTESDHRALPAKS